MLKSELSGLEKLNYLYQENNAKYDSLSKGEKASRIKTLNAFISSTKELTTEIQNTMGGRGGGSINMITSTDGNDDSTLDLEKKKMDTVRDADGEFSNTRGLDNQMLLQQQKNMIEGQDKQLDKIS